MFGDVPLNLELRLSVEDSPNSAGIVIDAIRCAKLALERNQSGILYPPSAFFMKHPPLQFSDNEAYGMTETFIKGTWVHDSKTMPHFSAEAREGVPAK